MTEPEHTVFAPPAKRNCTTCHGRGVVSVYRGRVANDAGGLTDYRSDVLCNCVQRRIARSNAR